MTVDLDSDDPRKSGRRTYPDQRKYPRFVTSIAASVEITTASGEKPFAPREAVISDISRGGVGLSLSVATTVAAEEVSKVFLQRLSCQISCHFPGSDSASCLIGTVAWVRPHKTDEGMELHFGVNLEGCDPSRMVALEAYLGKKETDGSGR